jgi:hypothetical protein
MASHRSQPDSGAPPIDPIRERRKKIAHWTLLANRIGYLVLALAMTLFILAFLFGFSPTMAALVITSLIVSFALLAPSIIVGYAVKAAERNDAELGV